MNRDMTARLRSQRLFSLLLVYYWGVQYTQMSGQHAERGNLVYFLYVVPVLFYVLISAHHIISHALKVERPAGLALVFGAIVATVGIVRLDFETVFTVGLLAAMVFVVFVQRVTSPSNLLNALFLASIVASAIAFGFGRSAYTVLPGFGVEDAVWFRVSLLPQVACSAFFSLVVFFINLLNPNLRFRKLFLLLSLYFLIFAALRSAIAAAVLASIFVGLRSLGLLNSSRSAMVFLWMALAAFVVILTVPELILRFSTPDGVLNLYLFRSRDTAADADSFTKSMLRTILWEEHFKIARLNPILGVGTFDLATFNPELGAMSIGSESFITNMYARIGLPILVLVFAFSSAIRQGLKSNGDMSMVVGITLFVAMAAYGGFIVGYDFTFLSMLGVLAGARTSANGGPASGRGRRG